MTSYSRFQFAIFRMVFGAYLAIHFAHLVPWAAELFGSRGLIGDPGLNPTSRLFPNPLNGNLSDSAITATVAALSVASVAFAAGFARRSMAMLLWFGWSCLFHRNNLIANPSIPYIGLLLLLTVLVPAGEGWGVSRSAASWEMPRRVPGAAWILLAAGYAFSGLTKLGSPSWIDGSAMARLMDNPLARPGPARDLMGLLPAGVPTLMTWGTLAAELLFAPLAMVGKTRAAAWTGMMTMHAGILLLLDFADLSLGMAMVHLFIFDPSWLERMRFPWSGLSGEPAR